MKRFLQEYNITEDTKHTETIIKEELSNVAIVHPFLVVWGISQEHSGVYYESLVTWPTDGSTSAAGMLSSETLSLEVR